MNEYSFTRISSFQECPRKYKYKYIDNISEIFINIEKHLGSVIHGVIQRVYERQSEKKLVFKELEEIYRELWNSSRPTNINIIKRGKKESDYFNEGKEILKNFFQDILIKDLGENLHTEHEFKIYLSDSILYKGVIDRISNNKGIINIIEYKTGKRIEDPSESLQLLSYALYANEIYSNKNINLCMVDLRNSIVIEHMVDPSRIIKIKKDLLERISIIQNTDNFYPKTTVLCDWCGFKSICTQDKSELNANKICPLCDGNLEKRYGRRGPFLGCENYPVCLFTREIDHEEDEGDKGDNDFCPWCGSELTNRSGKYGNFFGCTNFPDCRYTKDY